MTLAPPEKRTQKDRDDLLEFLLFLMDDALWDLYFHEYMLIQFESGMAEPLFPSSVSNGMAHGIVSGSPVPTTGMDFLHTMVAEATLSDRLTDVASELDVDLIWGQVERIAKTEGHRVMNAARFDAMQDNVAQRDLSAVKIWDATLDDRTRLTHVGLDGTVAAPDEYFWTANGAALYPGSFGIPEEDINCRCVLKCSINGNFKRISGEKDYQTWLQEVMENERRD